MSRQHSCSLLDVLRHNEPMYNSGDFGQLPLVQARASPCVHAPCPHSQVLVL